ncbi:tetratricopeptide repeat protein [Haliscomenobacter sp.]|uniref:tetratricopeptide repeat protein n=1 Tax=Haliscomenobacter sp. TaxID=2717303 RepID=UPI00359436FE
MLFKIILSGHLEFGSDRTFELALNMFLQRAETYYKNDILLKPDEVFISEKSMLDIPRTIINTAAEKSWRNTVHLLDTMAQYAIAGNIGAWKLDNGSMVEHAFIEPKGDKSAVQTFLRGRELLTQGQQSEAKDALSSAIEKYTRNALAYERRGYVNYKLGNVGDAMYDFTKSIDIYPHSPDAYMGRAIVNVHQKNYAAAAADLDMAIRTSIPHQPIHWRARRMKGECHVELNEFAKAEFELKLVTNKTFKAEDSNAAWQPRAYYNYGRALFGIGKYKEAFQAASKARTLTQEPSADLLQFVSAAAEKAGVPN